MSGENFTIRNVYTVHEGRDPNGKVLDEMGEQQFYGWLRTRGFSEDEAVKIVKQVADDGKATITMP